MKIIRNIEFRTKKRWVKDWWQKNINTFLVAIQNEEINEEIISLRKYLGIKEVSTNRKKLERIITGLYLREAEINGENKKCNIEIKNGKYYQAFKNSKGLETKYYVPNPLSLYDNLFHEKSKLVKVLANIDKEENKGILEPQLFTKNEHKLVYPNHNFLISALHRSWFMFSIDYHILRRINADYFIFWPFFFYYLITNDRDFTLKNALYLSYPVKLFWVEETGGAGSNFLTFKLYGDFNFSLITKFFEANKKNITKLNNLIRGSNVRAGSLSKIKSFEDIEKEIIKRETDAREKKKEEGLHQKNKSYQELLEESVTKEKSLADRLYESGHRNKKAILNKDKLNLIKVQQTKLKKEIDSIVVDIPNYKEIRKLIDKINSPDSLI